MMLRSFEQPSTNYAGVGVYLYLCLLCVAAIPSTGILTFTLSWALLEAGCVAPFPGFLSLGDCFGFLDGTKASSGSCGDNTELIPLLIQAVPHVPYWTVIERR